MPASYFNTNSNGHGYDNTGSYNINSYSAPYDDSRIDPVAYEGESNLSSSYSERSDVYDEETYTPEERFSTPLASIRTPNPILNPAPPTSEYDTTTNAPYAPRGNELDYKKGYEDGLAYNRGYEEGLAAAKRDADPEHNDTGHTEAHSTPGYGYSSMLLAHPARDGSGVSTNPPEGTASKYQNQFAPVAPDAGQMFDDSYPHGGLAMKSGHMGGSGLSETGVGAGAGSGRMGKGVERQPGLVKISAGVGRIGSGGTSMAGASNMGSEYSGGISALSKTRHIGGGSKPGTGGWKGAGQRLLRKAGEKSQKGGNSNNTVTKTGRKYY